jgi:hypothetical protein
LRGGVQVGGGWEAVGALRGTLAARLATLAGGGGVDRFAQAHRPARP